MVHRGRAVLTGAPAFSHCRSWFYQLDCQLHCGNVLPVRRGKSHLHYFWKSSGESIEFWNEHLPKPKCFVEE